MIQTTVSAANVHSATEFELHSGRGWLSAEHTPVLYVNRNDANGYYRALGLSPSASKDEIKAAYRRSALKIHPDLGGDEELFRFLSDVTSVLLDPKAKIDYDSVSNGYVYLGNMEREELARQGFFRGRKEESENVKRAYWTCLTDCGSVPGEDTEAWISLCWEASRAVGYRGKIRVGVVEGGHSWPCESRPPWGILTAGTYTFAVFQRGVEPNRLHALCAMIDLQKHLLNQIQQSGWKRAA